MNEVIRVNDVSRSFTVLEREAGLRGAWKDLTSRRKEVVEAVRGVSFSVERGERVGLIGPNGAGKSTTMPTLSARVGTTTVPGPGMTRVRSGLAP